MLTCSWAAWQRVCSYAWPCRKVAVGANAIIRRWGSRRNCATRPTNPNRLPKTSPFRRRLRSISSSSVHLSFTDKHRSRNTVTKGRRWSCRDHRRPCIPTQPCLHRPIPPAEMWIASITTNLIIQNKDASLADRWGELCKYFQFTYYVDHFTNMSSLSEIIKLIVPGFHLFCRFKHL